MNISKFVAAAVVVAGLAGLAPTAEAGTISVQLAAFSRDTGVGQGGEFKVTAFSGGYAPSYSQITAYDNGLFHSFCMERNEDLSGVTNYQLNTATVAGGRSGGNPDALSGEAARLFYAWWTNGWLANGVAYDYSNSSARTTDAEDMQLALWFLEGEVTQTQLTTWDNGKAQDYVDFANSVTWADLGHGTWSGIGDVRVVNNFSATGANKQDILVVVPLPPAALLGFGMLGGLGLIASRRRRRAQA